MYKSLTQILYKYFGIAFIIADNVSEIRTIDSFFLPFLTVETVRKKTNILELVDYVIVDIVKRMEINTKMGISYTSRKDFRRKYRLVCKTRFRM